MEKLFNVKNIIIPKRITIVGKMANTSIFPLRLLWNLIEDSDINNHFGLGFNDHHLPNRRYRPPPFLAETRATINDGGIVKLSGVWQTGVMNTQMPNYRSFRFPSEIISHAIWLYHRFCLRFRKVEELLAEGGIIVTYETIRHWCQKFWPDSKDMHLKIKTHMTQ